MRVAPREMNLLLMTLALVLLAGTYLWLEPHVQEWGEYREKQEALEARVASAQRLLDSRGMIEARLNEFSRGLPVFAAGKRAESELLPVLEKMAGDHALVLTRREADAEREAGELFETSITCHWEGDLTALVRFLFAQQSQGMVSDVRQLSVQPSTGRGDPPGQLRGTFTMDYAYRREAGAAANASPAAAANSAAAPPAAEATTTQP